MSKHPSRLSVAPIGSPSPVGKKSAETTPCPVARFSQLSEPRQALVRLCQSINHGHIREVIVRDREPLLIPPPIVMVEMKLNTDEGPRPELTLPDFDLPAEVRRLLRQFDRIKDGKIAELEVRSGVPRRGLVESLATELLP